MQKNVALFLNSIFITSFYTRQHFERDYKAAQGPVSLEKSTIIINPKLVRIIMLTRFTHFEAKHDNIGSVCFLLRERLFGTHLNDRQLND